MPQDMRFKHHIEYLDNDTKSHGDIVDVRRWMLDLAEFVKNVDYEGGRSIFSPDMVTFGTFAKSFLIGREQTEREQWRNVWSTVEDFRLLHEEMRVLLSPDRLIAIAAVPFTSTGFKEDGASFERTGRATIVLSRPSDAEPWVAEHTHMSLDRDMPARSFGHKPELSRA